MKRVQIPVNGITTHRNYQDGDCLSMVNLRSKNGSLHPITPRDASKKIPFAEYDIIFIHRNNDYENWIGVLNGNYHAQIFNAEDTGWIGNIDNEKILSVEQIGNTLSFITGSGIYYALFTEGKYKFLGQLPELPNIHMFKSYDSYMNDLSSMEKLPTNVEVTEDTIKEIIKGSLNKAINELKKNNKGRLYDAHLMRYAFRLYDGSLLKFSSPILILPRQNLDSLKSTIYGVYDKRFGSQSRVFVEAYRVFMDYDFSFLTQWSDIIKSVDIFLTPELIISSTENMIDFPVENAVEYMKDCIEITAKDVNKIEEASNFYFLKSIEAGKKATDEPLVPEEDGFPENLIYKERLPATDTSHHKTGSALSYAYNNRLHIAGINTEFYCGFKEEHFQIFSGSDIYYFHYNGTFKPNPNPADKIIIETEINTGLTSKTYSIYEGSLDALYANPYISYPDTRAKRMTFYEVRNGVCTFAYTAELKTHEFLDIAFFLKSDLKPITAYRYANTVPEPDTTQKATIAESNKLKVSELNNPFFFPPINSYQIGDGTILNLASNIMNVSDRNYSQFPLYIFTTSGIWTLMQGTGEIVYANVSSPTYYEAPVSSVIAPTPYGVAFLTARGLFIINGQQVNFISPQFEEVAKNPVIEKGEHWYNHIRSFKDAIPYIKEMIFNHFENELLINFSDSDHNLLFSFDSKQFFWNNEAVNFFVKNAYPNLYGSLGYSIKNWSKGGKIATVSFLTRALTFGTTDIKKIDRLILRGDFIGLNLFANNGLNLPGIILYQSNDNRNFKIIRSMFLQPQSYRDLNMGMFARSKYRNYILFFAGALSQDSSIDYIEINVEKEYNNEKMR